MNEEPKSIREKSWLGRTLFILTCLATLVALFYAEENWRGKRDWEQFKREWEAKGAKFDYASLVPPPVPEDQNFALTPIVASCYGAMLDKTGQEIKPRNTNVVNRLQISPVLDYKDWPTNGVGSREKATLTDLKPWQDYYRGLAAKTNFFPVAPKPQTPAQDVLFALGKYDSTIEELRQASRLPDSRFPLEYDKEDPFAILLPHLAAMKRCAQILQLRTIAELQNGQTEKAFDDVKLALRLTASVRTEPFMISQLVRIAMLQITLQPVWEGLAEHRWTDPQLTALEVELAKLNFLADYELAQRVDLGYMPKVLEYHRRTRNPENFYYFPEFGYNPRHPSEEELAVLVFRYCPGGWFYQNQLRYCRFVLQTSLPMFDASRSLALPATANRARAAQQAEVAHLNPYNFIEHQLLFPPPPLDYFTLSKLAERFASAQSSMDLARTAMALERYRLARGEFPESLAALAPQFIGEIPHDILNGQPLHYRRTQDGQFVLYSVGMNETDDGGEVGLTKNGDLDIRAGDWVWRYPQK
jgi:hypothetical protein